VTQIIAVLGIMILLWATPMQAKAESIFALTTTNSLLTFDSSTPGSVNSIGPVTGLQSGESLFGIDFRPATLQLYGLGSTNRLYTINTGTGAAAQVGSAGAFTLNGFDFGFDFNPTVDRIRVTSDTDTNLRLNPNDGTLTMMDTTLAYAAGDPNFGGNPVIVGSAYTNNFVGAGSTLLYGIDSALGILVTQNPPNNGTLNTVGGLGAGDISSGLVGFDISGLTGTAFASLTSTEPDTNSSDLYTINLGTGAASLIGTIGGGTTIRGLSVASAPAAIPEPTTIVLLASGVLAIAARAVTRRRKAERDSNLS